MGFFFKFLAVVICFSILSYMGLLTIAFIISIVLGIVYLVSTFLYHWNSERDDGKR
jgi:hypothetical protein